MILQILSGLRAIFQSEQKARNRVKEGKSYNSLADTIWGFISIVFIIIVLLLFFGGG